MSEDPLVNLLTRIEFHPKLLQELDACEWNGEKFEKYFTVPELFVLRNAIGILKVYGGEDEDNIAFQNLLKWFMLAMASDEDWLRRLGWFFRYMSAHANDDSYWPVLFHKAYLPKSWLLKDGKFIPAEFHKGLQHPDDIFTPAVNKDGSD